MSPEKGVYALLMRLSRRRKIVIGKMGTFVFSPGWYVYLGSAHGSGGLAARTARHRRLNSQKRKHWNVDYLGPFAPLSEIWYSFAPSSQEHAWASVVGAIPGASVPVPKFGAHDCKRCVSHLFHFQRC